MNSVEKDVISELEKEMNWKEKLILKLFSKTVCKACHLYRIKIINKILER